MANKLNMAIAKTHRLSTRLVGMQITAGTLVGVVLSAVQMSAGFLIVGGGLINGNYLIGFGMVIIGIAVALLIERLSLGGLSAIRMNSEKINELEAKFWDRLAADNNREPTAFEQKDYDRRRNALEKSRRIAIGFAATGMLLSAAVGDVFWHRLFESLGGMGVVYAGALALVIGLTFVHAELYKVAIDGTLIGILSDLHVQKAAVAVEGESMQVDMLEDAFEAVRSNAEAREKAEEKVKRAVVKGLMVGATQYEQGVLVEVVTEQQQKPLMIAAPKSKFMQHKDELRRLLMQNRNMSQRDIADHFGISRSTAGDWQKKVLAII
jgi:hypothetical protein